jgi:lysophospholipase L1-like esterase
MWARYLALGDSVTAGYGDDTDDLECRSWADWLVDGLRAATPSLEYRNVAAPGATAAVLLASQVPEIERFRPDLVSVTVGANDARVAEWTAEGFKDQFATILRCATSAGAQVMTATYADVESTIRTAGGEIRNSWRLYFDRMHEVNEAIREVGRTFDAVLVDMESSEANDARYLSRDFTHPNALAYRLIGRVAHQTLLAR